MSKLYESPNQSPVKRGSHASPSIYNEGLSDEIDGYADSSMKLPVKSHIQRLEDMLAEVRAGIEESKKNAQVVRADIITSEHTLKESNNGVVAELMEECLRVEKEFRKTVDIEKSENEFLKQQIRQLQQDKMKLQQSTLVLENRVEGSENDVGFKHFAEYQHNPGDNEEK